MGKKKIFCDFVELGWRFGTQQNNHHKTSDFQDDIVAILLSDYYYKRCNRLCLRTMKQKEKIWERDLHPTAFGN